MPGAPIDRSAKAPSALRGDTLTWGICMPSGVSTHENEKDDEFFPSCWTYV